VYQCAVSETPGIVKLDEGHAFALNNGTARVVDQSANAQIGPSCRPGPLTGRSCAVESVRLDEVLLQSKCGVAKIDVEGHEWQVLSGATDLLPAPRRRHAI